MRPTQLKLNFIELEKQEKEKERKEIKRLTLVFVAMMAFFIIFAGCGWVLKFYQPEEFFTKGIFLRSLFLFGLIFSAIGLMLSVLAMVGSEQEKPSPKLKLKTPVQS